MPEAPGSALGPFRIVAPIGTGGFATVYRARDERLDSDVAIKVLAENHSLDPDIRERFLREARLLRKVASDHIVGLLDIGETDRQQPYLVLELAAGGDLRQRMERVWAAGHQVAAADLEAVARALGAALDAVHAHGIVHRDVSPGNLLILPGPSARPVEPGRVLAPDERVVLADLGLAKDLRQHSGFTVSGGTQGFSAPQQRDGVGTTDPRADVYAASAVLAWMCTGSTPDDLANQEGGATAGLRAAAVPAALAEVVGRGLAYDPDERQPEIRTWWAAAVAALATSSADLVDGHPAPKITGDPSEPATRSPPPRVASAGRSSRRLTLVAGLVALTVVAAAAAAVAFGGDDDGKRRIDLGDGQVQVERSDGPVQAAIFGPAVVTVGETATFEAGIVGGDDYLWVTPEGMVIPGQPSIEVTAESVGRATVRLAVTEGGAEPLWVELEFDVTDE